MNPTAQATILYVMCAIGVLNLLVFAISVYLDRPKKGKHRGE